MNDLRPKRHDWHMFDEVLGYEVRRIDTGIEIRDANDPDREPLILTPQEFNQLRGTGPKPRGLS